MFIGALAQSIPDIDFISAAWMDTPSGLLAHRGFTHSILFGILITFFMAVAIEYWHRKHDYGLKRWLLFIGMEVATHLFIDAFNNYGIGWFEPFSHRRISFNTIYVADPFFSIWPAMSLLALMILKQGDRRRKSWVKWGLALSSLYLFYGVLNKMKIDHVVKVSLEEQGISYHDYLTTPTPLNNWLWYAVAATDSGYQVGYRSVFDRGKRMEWTYFPRREELLQHVSDHEELMKLKRFSQGFYTAEQWSDTLVFNDLRFGQVTGWYDPHAIFAFHYFLSHHDNKLVVQRGRFANWNRTTMKALLRRIGGR